MDLDTSLVLLGVVKWSISDYAVTFIFCFDAKNNQNNENYNIFLVSLRCVLKWYTFDLFRYTPKILLTAIDLMGPISFF